MSPSIDDGLEALEEAVTYVTSLTGHLHRSLLRFGHPDQSLTRLPKAFEQKETRVT